MTDKILNIIINKKQETVCLNNATNVKFVGYPYYFQTDDGTTYHFLEINEDPTLISFEDYSFVKFIIHGDKNVETCFSKNVSKRLLDYFMKGQNVILCDKHDRGTPGCSRGHHDCCGFVNYLYDELCTNMHSVRLTRTENIMVGDVIFMAKQMRAPYSNVHYAIYLGDGLYISKFGNSGSIIFNELAELMIGFGSEVYGVVEMIE